VGTPPVVVSFWLSYQVVTHRLKGYTLRSVSFVTLADRWVLLHILLRQLHSHPLCAVSWSVMSSNEEDDLLLSTREGQLGAPDRRHAAAKPAKKSLATPLPWGSGSGPRAQLHQRPSLATWDVGWP
jgi:hypothetical protein